MGIEKFKNGYEYNGQFFGGYEFGGNPEEIFDEFFGTSNF